VLCCAVLCCAVLCCAVLRAWLCSGWMCALDALLALPSVQWAALPLVRSTWLGGAARGDARACLCALEALRDGWMWLVSCPKLQPSLVWLL
jgi:hypothetical protein